MILMGKSIRHKWVNEIQLFVLCQRVLYSLDLRTSTFEPRYEKTGLRGFRPGLTQTGLYNHIRWLEA